MPTNPQFSRAYRTTAEKTFTIFSNVRGDGKFVPIATIKALSVRAASQEFWRMHPEYLCASDYRIGRIVPGHEPELLPMDKRQ